MQSLVNTGHAYNREDGVITCVPDNRSSRLATSIRTWLVEDSLASLDMANHHYLTRNFPMAPRRRRPRDGDFSEEPIAQRARAALVVVLSVALFVLQLPAMTMSGWFQKVIAAVVALRSHLRWPSRHRGSWRLRRYCLHSCKQ